MNGVIAMADMLAHAELPAREREMAQIIRASGDSLQRLLSDILDMARIESGKLVVETAPFHLGDAVRAVAHLSALLCQEKGLALSVEIAPGLDRPVLGDSVRVRQVLTNFLSNAAKFTDAGGITVQVQPTPDGHARFMVSDTGIGFAMIDKPRVLGRFEQADSSITRRFGGSGLGLSICSDLARLMGGAIDCESEPGRGTRFWMDVPLPPTSEHLTKRPETVVELEGNGLRVLVADDHPTNRKVVEVMLSSVVPTLTMVENGAEALDRLRTQDFHLVLMDMQMPVMDGLTCVRELRQLEAETGRRRTPVVMLTANALPEHVNRALAVGADLHLAKPFTAAALFEAVAAVLTSEEKTDAAAA